jgi:hypothetical protein
VYGVEAIAAGRRGRAAPGRLALGCLLEVTTALHASCSTDDAAHVIGPGGAGVAPSIVAAGSGHASSPSVAGPSPTTTPLSSTSLSEIDSQLQQLSTSLNQASSDLNRARKGG